MLPFKPRLPSRNEVSIAVGFVLVFLFASWLRRGEKIAALESELAAKPRVEFRDRVVEKRVVVKGPIRIIKVQSADGTVTTTTDRAPEIVSTDKDKEITRVETPICPAARAVSSRYIGLIAGAAGYGGSWIKGFRGGVNILDNWDLGANVTREKSGATVFGADLTFRW